MFGWDKMFDFNHNGKLSPLERSLQFAFWASMRDKEEEECSDDTDLAFECDELSDTEECDGLSEADDLLNQAVPIRQAEASKSPRADNS